ncbi:hypothetical protein ACIQJT_33260 [Streptomyces sp. NPDC091972]|uniref:hypothetical protein n=1 Tax=Streptomyces sp. NPDC091972 TaxID=3366007 RepID=UPI0038271F24
MSIEPMFTACRPDPRRGRGQQREFAPTPVAHPAIPGTPSSGADSFTSDSSQYQNQQLLDFRIGHF